MKSKRSRSKKVWVLRVLHRVLISGCFFFILFFSQTQVLEADPFYPSGDTKFCQFAQAAAISYSKLPESSSTAGLKYDVTKVKGRTLDWITSTNIEAVADVTFPDARRINNLADHVSVPPNTTVDLDAYFYNYSGHSITIFESLFYTSMPNVSQGDLTRLGAPGTERHEGFIYESKPVNRTGKAFTTNAARVVPAHAYSNLPKGERITSFETIQPLHIKKRSVRPEFRDGGKLYLVYDTEIENISTYSLSNITLEDALLNGEKHIETFSIQPKGIKSFNYEICLCYDYAYDIAIPPLKLIDPNSHLEFAGEGTNSLFSYASETRIFLTRRHDSGSTPSWSAWQGDFTTVGTGPFISIELLPYEVYSQPQMINLLPDVLPQPLLKDDDEVLVDENQIKQDETVKLVLELKNGGAYLKDIDVEIGFDPTILEYVGDPGVYVESGVLNIKIPRIENSEIKNIEILFKAVDTLAPGNYDAVYNVSVKSWPYLDFTKTLHTQVTIEAAEAKTPVINTEKPPKSLVSFSKDSSPRVLANTGMSLEGFLIDNLKTGRTLRNIAIIILLWTILKHFPQLTRQLLQLQFRSM